MNKKVLFVSIALIILSVAAGAVYQTLCAKQSQMGDYISSFAVSLSNGVDHRGIIINSLKEGLLTVSLIFVCGFLRFGFPLAMLGAARRCFVSGFTCAALIERYGIKGFAAAAAAELPFMITLIPLALLLTLSVGLSFSSERRSGLKGYILVGLGSAVIFFCAAVCESYAVVPLLLLTIGK